MGHHGISDEVRRFLEIDINDEDDRNRVMDDPPSGTEVAILVTTTDGNYPTTAAAFYKCGSISLTGNEREGDAFTVGGGGAVVYAANLGSAVPPVGTYVLGVKVPERWAFLFNG